MQRNKRIRYIIAALVNTAIFGIMVYVFITLIRSLIHGSNRFITFTFISNLTVGLMSIFNAVFLLISVFKNKDSIPKIFSLIKITAISMTTLTFFTVLFVIGPIDGYPHSYSGRDFYAHLLVPLLSLLSYLFLEEAFQYKWKYSLLMSIPFIIYSIAYVINVVILQTWPDIYHINDYGLWYLFLIAFLVGNFGLGQGLYFSKIYTDKKLHD